MAAVLVKIITAAVKTIAKKDSNKPDDNYAKFGTLNIEHNIFVVGQVDIWKLLSAACVLNLR